VTLTHDERVSLARRALDGLSVGDAFGDTFFARPLDHEQTFAQIDQRLLPATPWQYTDDTQMALSLVSILKIRGSIDQNRLAASFAAYYEPTRKYGASMHRLLRALRDGKRWKECATDQFSGQGSYGNGAAMRVAPLGAFFADDPAEAARQAQVSAEVTHTHPEAIAGAIAIAVAAALAWQHAQSGKLPTRQEFIEQIIPWLPESEVRSKTRRARDISERTSVESVAAMLGSGYGISAQDTVPFVLWCAGESLANYEEALWLTVRGLGDLDTTCAMVGGIVALSCTAPGIPTSWLQAREPLPDWV
jgi:ADP-ribosylglycohydrolase